MPAPAVIFDLDGTLLDSLEDIGESMNFVLKGMGLEEHPLSAYRGFVGDGVTVLAERALPPGKRDRATVTAVVARMRLIYGGRATLKTRPYEGVPALLDELAARGIGLAVLSNKPHDLTVQLVADLLGRWNFAVIFGERASVPRKPDPAAALEIAGLLALPASSIVYVGDTATDMATARAAGMRAVGVTWGFRSEAELRGSGAVRIARRPLDVLEHVIA
ncbi:MAG: HAD family hydrolase [Candidatus Binatia bacterium]